MDKFWEGSQLVATVEPEEQGGDRWWQDSEPLNLEQSLTAVYREAARPYFQHSATIFEAPRFPNFRAGFARAGAGILGPVLNDLAGPFVGKPAELAATRLQANAAAMEQLAEERARRETKLPIVARAARGALASLPAARLGGQIAGPYGALAAGGLSQRDASYFEAKQQGLSDEDAQRYANEQGALEFGVGAAFQGLGLGGLETVLGSKSPAVQQGFRQGITRFLKDTGQELAEEHLTELAQAVDAKLRNVDPNALSPESLQQLVADTTAQTVLTMGVAEGLRPQRQQPEQTAQNDAELQARLNAIEQQYREQAPDREAARSRLSLLRENIRGQRAERDAKDAFADRMHDLAQQQIEPSTPSPPHVPLPWERDAESEAFGNYQQQQQRQNAEREANERQADELARHERELYESFYRDPNSAADYVRRFPEQAQRVAGLKTYKAEDFQAVDPDLPALSGGPEDARLRRQWRSWVSSFAADPSQAELVIQAHEQSQLPENERDPLAWQRLPEGVEPPPHPAIEVRETPSGRFVRFRRIPRPSNESQEQPLPAAPEVLRPPLMPTPGQLLEQPGQATSQFDQSPPAAVQPGDVASAASAGQPQARPQSRPSELPSDQAKSWLIETIARRPADRDTPQKIAAWIRSGFPRGKWQSFVEGHPSLEAAVTAVLGPQSPAKQPWQMTRDEFIKWAAENHPAEAIRRSAKSSKVNQPGSSQALSISAVRDNSVRQAYLAGETIPPEVLNDFPDLKSGRLGIDGRLKWAIHEGPGEENATTSTPATTEAVTGLADVGGKMGAGITDAMYDMLWKKVLAGHTIEAGKPSALLQVAAAIRKAGGMQSRDELKRLAQDFSAIRDQGLKGEEYQNALRNLVTSFQSYDNVSHQESPKAESASWSGNDTPDATLANWVTQRLAQPGPISDNEFFAEADRQFGGTRSQGRYGDSRAYDALESGVNQFLLTRTDPTADTTDAKATVEQLERISSLLPTHKSRTGNKDKLQQFSTPPAYAYVATWAANPSAADVVLEPSAGTGGLVAHALNSNARVYANEIDPDRAALVQKLPVQKVFTEDAEFIGGSLAKKMPAPTVIVMNPPFSRAGHRLGDKMVQGTDRKHIDSALQLLQPGGRLVAIVGAGLHGRGVGFDNWLQNLPYSVRADVEVGRDVYRGHGTTFPTRLLVIDKTPREGAAVTGSAQSLPELVDLLEEVRNARPTIAKADRGADRAEPESAQPAGQEVPAAGEGGRRPVPAVQPAAGPVDSGRASGPGASPSERLRAGTDGGRAEDAGVGTAQSSGAAPVGAGQQPGSGGGRRGGKRSGQRVRGSEGTGDSAGGDTGGSALEQPAGQRTEPAPGKPVAALEVRQAQKRQRQDLADSTYEEYQPSISVPGSQKHPGAIVESAAMAAVSMPAIQYQPKIPRKVIEGYTTDDGTKIGISDIQLEAVAAAGQAHEQMLPDTTRRGFMVGDGTGVGKAREIVGIILDNFNQGRTKAIWVSKNASLLGPAREEWKRIGGNPEQVLHQAKVGSGKPVTVKDGIVFTTYGTLPQEASKTAIARGDKLSRLDQLVEWVGEDFDGVLVYDEAHQMRSAVETGKGLDKKKASKAALAGVDLQNRLPKARVVYLSATSATEVANLAYAQRLGLWGEGTPFATVHDFINAISAGGVAAMEKVAGDMKALGMYLARNLSFNDGTAKGRVEYDRIEHTLTDDQVRTYDKAAEAWGIVLENMNEAIQETGASKNGHALGRARGAFWSANQRFWNQVITAMQTPAVIKQIENDLANGASAVVQLTNTNEADQNRALDSRDEEDDYDNIDLSPRRILMDYIEKSFPTVQYEEFTDDNGNIRTRPAKDSEGNLIHNPEAVAMKEKMLDELGSLNLANRGALDMIVDHFGAENVAEVTGRNERLQKVNGRLERAPHGEGARKADVADFMAGRKRVLIFSEAGGTGASYHTDLTRQNQQKRHHYLLQAGWKADTAIQGLGRTHRSNQAQAPLYRLVHTNLKGQKRFISTIARRLAQLGALTKGQRQAGEAGLFSPADNLESTEAREALNQFYRDAVAGGIPGVDLHYLETTLGLVMLNNQGQLKSQLPPITQFMNRVLSLPVMQQNRVFEEFQKRLDARVEQAIASGTLDQGMETVKAAKIEKVSEQVVYRHPTGAETKHVAVKVFRKTEPKTWEQAQNNRVVGYVQSARSGRVAAVEDTGTSEQDKDGTLHKKLRLVGPTSVDFLTADKLKNTNYWKSLEEDEAKRLWQEQLKSLPPYSETEMHLLTGVLLPVWDRLPKKTAQVKRLLTTDGEQILGRVIHADDLPKVLKGLGASMSAPKLSPEQAVDAVMRGKTLVLANDWRIKRSRVDGEWTIEVVGPDYSHDRELERQGVFKRRVQYQTRYFIPTGDNAADVLEAVIRNRPIADVLGQGQGTDNLSLREDEIARKPITRQTRSTVANGPDEAGIAAADIIKTWERLFDVPIRTGGFSKRAAGIYKLLPEVVRTKEKHYANLAVAAHEVAHHIDKQTNIAGADSRQAPTIPSHLQSEVAGLDYEPKGRLFEGFAEFVRHYITENDAELLAPNFHRWFVNDWMPKNQRWAKALREAQRHARQYADQTVFQRIRSAIGRPGDDLDWSQRLKQRAQEYGRWLFRAFVDRAAPLKMIEEEAAKRGADFSKKAGVYETFLAYDLSANANAAMALERGVHALSDGRKLGDSLWGLAKHLHNDVERDEAVAYAWARHTLHESHAKRGYNTGLDVKDAEAMVRYVEEDEDKHERYEAVARGIADYANATLEMLVDAGALSEAAKERMVRRYGEFYFPLLRSHYNLSHQTNGGMRFVNLPPAVIGRSAKGSGRPILDPFDALVGLTVQRYSRAAKARVAHSLAETLDPRLGGVEGMGGLMDRVDPHKVVTEGKLGDILSQLVDEGVVEADDARAMRIASRILAGETVAKPNLKWFAARHGLNADADLTAAAQSEPDLLSTIGIWKQDYTPNAKMATVVIHDKQGKPVMYEMDRALYDVATGMDGLQFGGFARILRSAAQVFKVGATGLSTGFGVTNLLRDYFEYQGRAENVKGEASLGKPLEMVGRFVGLKARRLAGESVDDALIDTFEQAGGKLFTRLGSDMASRQRTRQRKLGSSTWHSPWHVKDVALSGVENLQELIAWTDAPPRLAEMEAAGRALGYEARGGDWYDIATGQKVDLPEFARIKMLNAGAEATVNFKRAGSVGRYIDSFVPFFNATIQASYREARQLRALGRIGTKKADTERAQRYLVYLSAAAATSWLVWLLRHDDDDYREQEPWLKEGFWTWGTGGRTYLRIPKPRDLGALVANLTEAALDAWYHDDADGAMAEVVGRHAMTRMPDGGGPITAAVETLVANHDYFRDRPVEPEYLKSEPKALRATPYTLATSKVMGRITAPTIGLSPVQVEHLLNGSTGGAYRRMADAGEAVAEGRLGPEHLPFVRGLVLNRHQSRSLDDFYTEWERLKLAAKWEEARGGSVSSDTAAQKTRLDDYAGLMTQIRALDKKDARGRRSFQYEPHLVGLAREALEREPLEANPSPFSAAELPDEIKAVVTEFASRKAKSAILSHGMPTKAHQGDRDLEETMDKWRQSRDADEAWLKEHEQSPYVKDAIRGVLSEKGFKDLLRGAGRPRFDGGRETWEEYQRGLKRFEQKRVEAKQWTLPAQ